jgi:hypothetical protein
MAHGDDMVAYTSSLCKAVRGGNRRLCAHPDEELILLDALDLGRHAPVPAVQAPPHRVMTRPLASSGKTLMRHSNTGQATAPAGRGGAGTGRHLLLLGHAFHGCTLCLFHHKLLDTGLAVPATHM